MDKKLNIATEKDRPRILQYLKQNVQDCLYLYIDITNYGVSTPFMQVWYAEEEGELSLVVMKYYDSYQVYSHKTEGELEEVYELIQRKPVAMISGRRDIIERLEGRLPDYKATYGLVFRGYPCYELLDSTFHLSCATEKDTREIAELMCSEENFSAHYTVEGLKEQLAERIRTGTGRSFIARNDKGKLVAHIATFAEMESLAVISGAVVDRAYRKTDVYTELDTYAAYHMGREQKEIYAFAIEKRMIYLHKMLGTGCGEYGKLVKRK